MTRTGVMAKSLLVAVCVFTLAQSVFASTLIDINTADKSALTTLSGIGDVKAQSIIDYRSANGPFTTIEGIMNVSGIGTATFNNIKNFITVGGSSPADTSAQQSPSPENAPGTSTAQSTQATASAPVSSYVAPPEPTMFVDAGGDRMVIVGADTVFNGRAYNKKKEDVDHVRFMWNFGDGSTAEGPSVLHHYEYPGRYAVMLTIAENRTALSAQAVVTAESARLSFTSDADGSVTIGNLAGRDLDLSEWIVRSFNRTFTLPEHSVILAGSSMRISQKTLNFFSGLQTELDYPNGALALNANGSTQETAAPAPAERVSPAVVVSANSTTNAVVESAASSPREDATTVDAAVPDATSTQVAAAALAGSGGGYWWLGSLCFAGVLGAGVVAIRRIKKSEWDIVEETK